MCRTCGCGSTEQRHDHGAVRIALKDHVHVQGKLVRVQQSLLAKNDALAQRNRAWFAQRRVLALNLVSSPGAGKTALLERTVVETRERWPISVIQGDQATERDAERIRRAGAPAVQLNTGEGCHLDAAMIDACLGATEAQQGSLLAIENVGNLVCPALFDLGEYAKVVILSVTEGADKPLKYPHMFRASRLMLVSKLDLLPHVPFDIDECVELARQVNPEIEVIRLSSSSGDGMEQWYRWLQARLAEVSQLQGAPAR